MSTDQPNTSSEAPRKIIVKKYANRRLYDMTNSTHLTQDQLIELIKQGYDVEVVDSKKKEDITQSVLTHILLEMGRDGKHLFSTTFLHQLIRNRDGVVRDFFTDFVPRLLDSYLEMRDTMKRQLSTIVNPVNWLTATTKDLKSQWLNPIFPHSSEASSDPSAEPDHPSSETSSLTPDEVAQLRQKIHELEAEVDALKKEKQQS